MMKISILIFALICSFETTFSKKRVLKFTKLECKGQEPYLNISLCKLKPINRFQAQIFFEFNLKTTFKKGKVIKFNTLYLKY